MESRTCNSCGWFVEETETIGDYQHSEAVKRQRGFCLVQDLFTVVEPDCKVCKEYTLAAEESCGNRFDEEGDNDCPECDDE